MVLFAEGQSVFVPCVGSAEEVDEDDDVLVGLV